MCYIRVLHSTEPTAFHGLFLYLEDRFIVKDKSEMWKCISVVAQKAFEMFLSVKNEKVRDISFVRENVEFCSICIMYTSYSRLIHCSGYIFALLHGSHILILY